MIDQSEIVELYFGDMNDEPFVSILDQRAAWLSFVDMILLLMAKEAETNSPTVYGRVSFYNKDALTVDILGPAGDETFDPKLMSPQIYDVYEALKEKGYKDGEPVSPLSLILSNIWSNAEYFGVILAMAYSSNGKYGHMFSRLYGGNDEESMAPTVGLCCDLMRFFFNTAMADPSQLLSPESYGRRCLFVEDDTMARSGMNSPLILRPLVLAFLGSGEPALSALAPCARIMVPPDVANETICLKDTYEELLSVIDKSRVIELSGSEGGGRRYLLSCAAASQGRYVVTVDMKLLAELFLYERQKECIDELVFLGSSCKCVIYLWCQGDPTGYAGILRETFFVLTNQVPTTCIGTSKPITDNILGGLCDSVFRIKIPDTTSHDQELLWQVAAKKHALAFAKDVNLSVMVSKYVMSPGRIFETMSNLSDIIEKTGTSQKSKKANMIEEKTIEEQIRRSCSVQFGDAATRLGSPFTWDDLMISPESEKLLHMAADRVRYRSTVNEDFGFAKKLPYGRGVAIVFYGPPGTGKTMAAQVLANELGLDIYRIDLSQVSSKYIGETEKNLGAVFDAAKNSNAILFFDEADSLFAKRTSVSSSNDKYANAETSYLLQKIEEYTGVSVLATNNMQNFDAAFKRRMTYLIPVESPDENTRVRLWESVFPPEAPLDPLVDLRILARVGELTGSNIKSAAVSASYMAAAEGRAIKWDDLIKAVDLEGSKAGAIGLGNRLREAILTGID